MPNYPGYLGVTSSTASINRPVKRENTFGMSPVASAPALKAGGAG
jgi:hypothetical protein